jgi:hypothetical protein
MAAGARRPHDTPGLRAGPTAACGMEKFHNLLVDPRVTPIGLRRVPSLGERHRADWPGVRPVEFICLATTGLR